MVEGPARGPYTRRSARVILVDGADRILLFRASLRHNGQLVAEASGYADLGWAKGMFHDTFFFHRTTVHEVDTSGFEDGERSQISAHRWWALAEVARASDPIYPFGLAPLLADLLAGRIPPEPVRLPWHH